MQITKRLDFMGLVDMLRAKKAFDLLWNLLTDKRLRICWRMATLSNEDWISSGVELEVVGGCLSNGALKRYYGGSKGGKYTKAEAEALGVDPTCQYGEGGLVVRVVGKRPPVDFAGYAKLQEKSETDCFWVSWDRVLYWERVVDSDIVNASSLWYITSRDASTSIEELLEEWGAYALLPSVSWHWGSEREQSQCGTETMMEFRMSEFLDVKAIDCPDVPMVLFWHICSREVTCTVQVGGGVSGVIAGTFVQTFKRSCLSAELNLDEIVRKMLEDCHQEIRRTHIMKSLKLPFRSLNGSSSEMVVEDDGVRLLRVDFKKGIRNEFYWAYKGDRLDVRGSSVLEWELFDHRGTCAGWAHVEDWTPEALHKFVQAVRDVRTRKTSDRDRETVEQRRAELMC